MLNERYLLWGSAMALVACLVFAAWGRSTIDPRSWKTVEATLERARKAGHQVELIARMGEAESFDEVPPNEGVTQLLLSKSRAWIRPSAQDSALFSPTVQTSLEDSWVAPYLADRDYDGAVKGLARGYLGTLEAAREVPLLPRPAPILGPSNKNQIPNVHITAHWGVPFAIAIFLFGVWLSRVSQRLGNKKT